MSVYVIKFGGTSVANISTMRHAINHINQLKKDNHRVVVVISAMANETNYLNDLINQTEITETTHEHDVIMSTGEQKSSGLMALLLKAQGINAQSLQGWQLPIRTTNHCTRARIVAVECKKIRYLLDCNSVPVISGFQGIDNQNQITTLGRGGSDITAIAVAAALNADQCILFKDVNGIAACDPKIIPNAKLLSELTYHEMLEMTSLGAKVIQPRAVELAMRYNVPLQIKSTFSNDRGTIILNDRNINESETVAAIVYNDQETRFCLTQFPITSLAKLLLLRKFATEKIKLDMLIHQGPLDEKNDNTLTFTVLNSESDKTINLCNELKKEIGFQECIIHNKVAKISLIGIGLKNNLMIAVQVFETLVEMGILLYGFTYSELTFTILISSTYGLVVMHKLSQLFKIQQ